MKCKHTYPKRKMPRRYVTEKFLMCGRCKKKIRKLTSEDMGRLEYVKKLNYPPHSLNI